MRSSGLTLKELADALDLSARSLQRRRRGRLARFESDRLYRLARLLALARQSLGDPDRATRWLKRTNRALGGLAPLAAIDTELGARQVESLLGRIAYGGIVDQGVSGAARRLCAHTLRRRRRVPLRGALVKPGHAPLHL